MRRRFPIALLALMAVAGLARGSLAASAENRGGSDYHWFKVGGPGQEAIFARYGVVLGYPDQQAEIDRQLATMYANGQRRLRIAMEFADDDAAYRLHLTNGDFTAADKARIAALFAAIKHAGFEQVLVNIEGGGANNGVIHWKQWNETAYRENFGAIVQTRDILKASGLPYLLDLGGEYTPAAKGQEILLQYCRRLWADYFKAFGSEDTVGFSIIPTLADDRFVHLRDIYGRNLPKAFDLHIYGRRDEATGNYTEAPYQRFIYAHKRLAEVGYGGIPWVIGESFYNDGWEADQLAQAVKETGQRILFLLQFPYVRPPYPKPPHYSEVDLVPLEFDQYIARGF
jgi:hypothetical protein